MRTEKNLLDLLDMKHLMTFQTVILQRGRGRSHVKGVKQRMCEQEVKAEFVLFEKFGGERNIDKLWPDGVARSQEGYFSVGRALTLLWAEEERLKIKEK